jgi:hypothetical protein
MFRGCFLYMVQIQNQTSGIKNRNPKRSNRNWARSLVTGALALIFALVILLAIVPAAFPGFGADMADLLRTVVGPQPVAVLESVSFSLHDTLNRYRSAYDGGKPQISWGSTNEVSVGKSNETTGFISTAVQSKPSVLNNETFTVVTAPPKIGWQAYGPTVNGTPVMGRALVSLDPQRPYTGVALVRVDLSELQLHMMPGTVEPSHPSQIGQTIPDLGMVSREDQTHLMAAFDGGFKGIHGHFGMMVNGISLLPPIPDLATVALYQDGHVQIGVWGKDILPSSDMIAFRQNCPPLIDAGQINPDLSLDNRDAWGYTNNSDITWRTGLGITQDGRYLIYAVGNGTTAQTFSQAFHDAGAYSAMQLDINQFYAHFNTYQPVNNPAASQGFQLTGQRLLDEMINNPHLYLTPNTRDFFYLTVR